MLEKHLGENPLGEMLIVIALAWGFSYLIFKIQQWTGWFWFVPGVMILLPLSLLAIVIIRTIKRGDEVSEQDIIGYQLVPIRRGPAGGMATAALLQDFVTNETLATRGGGAMAISPQTYLTLREDDDVRNLIRQKVDTPRVSK